eukprot:Tamp_16852.p1 GENE.Tamp_16852~~Tamp_16852.p1  ORF type:complete len:404 (-),score=11.04 Tamp_16852:219-1349(-)
MDLVVLCWLVLMCILSGLSAIAVWSLYKFSAQKSRRAPRRNGDVGVARRERERRATSELAATRAHVHEAPQPPRGACVGKDAKSTDRSPPAFRRHVSDGAVGVGPARGGKKPARLANLQLTERVTAGPRKRPLPLPGSGSLDEATAAPIAHGRSVLKARDATACAPATAPGQSTVSSETVPAQAGPPGRLAKRLDAPLQLTDRSEPRRHLRPGSGSFDKAVAHGRSAKARDTKECAPATAPGQSTVSSETVPAQAGSHRRSLRRSGPADQALAHDRAAGNTLSARSSGMPVPGSTSFPLAPGGPPQPLVSPPPRRGGSLTGSNSSIRMLLAQANDEACPPTPLPKPAHARRPLSGTSYHHVVRKLSPRGKTLVRTL